MIYFIAAEGSNQIKIGFTDKDPLDRLATLQTGNPHKLTLVATVEGDKQTEKELHQRFASDRTNGEWFNITPRLLIYVAHLHAETRLLAMESRIAKLEYEMTRLRRSKSEVARIFDEAEPPR
jgi:hypothetical protein